MEQRQPLPMSWIFRFSTRSINRRWSNERGTGNQLLVVSSMNHHTHSLKVPSSTPPTQDSPSYSIRYAVSIPRAQRNRSIVAPLLNNREPDSQEDIRFQKWLPKSNQTKMEKANPGPQYCQRGTHHGRDWMQCALCHLCNPRWPPAPLRCRPPLSPIQQKQDNQQTNVQFKRKMKIRKCGLLRFDNCLQESGVNCFCWLCLSWREPSE